MATTPVVPVPTVDPGSAVTVPTERQADLSQQDRFKRMLSSVSTPAAAAPPPPAPAPVMPTPATLPATSGTQPAAASQAPQQSAPTLDSKVEDPVPPPDDEEEDLVAALAKPPETDPLDAAPAAPAEAKPDEGRETDLDKFFNGPRGQRIYGAYKRQKEIADAVGYAPSPEEVVDWIQTKEDLDSIVGDFNSPAEPLPQESVYAALGFKDSGDRWLAQHFGPQLHPTEDTFKVDAKGQRVYVKGAEELAARLPEFLRDYNPGAYSVVLASTLRQYAEHMKAAVLDNPGTSEETKQFYGLLHKQIEKDAAQILRNTGRDPDKPLRSAPQTRELTPVEKDFQSRISSAVSASREVVLSNAIDKIVPEQIRASLAPSVYEGVKLNYRHRIMRDVEAAMQAGKPALRMMRKYEQAAHRSMSYEGAKQNIGRARAIFANVISQSVERERAALLKELGAKSKAAVPNTTVHTQAQSQVEVPKGPASPVPAQVQAPSAGPKARQVSLGVAGSAMQDRIRQKLASL